MVVQRTPETLEHFPLDILPSDFEQLPDLTGEDLVRLTRWALFQIPVRPEETPATSKMPVLGGQPPTDP